MLSVGQQIRHDCLNTCTVRDRGRCTELRLTAGSLRAYLAECGQCEEKRTLKDTEMVCLLTFHSVFKTSRYLDFIFPEDHVAP